MASGKVCVLDLDVQGVRSLKSLVNNNNVGGEGGITFEDAKYVFIAPPDLQTLERRLRDRGSESEGDIQTRLGNAEEEILYGRGGNFDVVVVNDDVDKASEELAKAIEGMYPGVVKRS